MPKKKKDKGEEGIQIIGRPGNNVKMGIVGLPNVGKSTLFNVLSGLNVPAENYAFCTIDPSAAQVPVPDPRFNLLCEHFKPASEVSAQLNVWDIAGLVRGANEGNGLGNDFLSHIGAVDGIFHCVRAFSDKKIEHVDGDVDPIRDLKTISDELRLKDITIVKNILEKKVRLSERNTKDKALRDEVILLDKVYQLLLSGGEVRLEKWENKEIDLIRPLNLFTAKPVVFLVNVSLKNWLQGGNKWIKKIKKWVKTNSKGSKVVPFSAKFEAKIADMKPEERAAYLKEVERDSHLSKIIWAGYKSLNLIHYFTCGKDEVKCWTIRNGIKAPKAAGVIHTDFEKGFIKAETMKYEDFVEFDGEPGCRANGKYRSNGKEYVVCDGDILFFKFNN